MTSSQSNSSSRTLWIVVLFIMLFLLGSCGVGVAGLFYWLQRGSEPSKPTVVRRVSAPVALQTPLPQVIVATPESGIDYETATLMNIYAQVNPSVVNVSIFQKNSSLHEGSFSDFNPDDLLEVGGGSGFVWDDAGHIVTNQHVVDSAEELHVKFSDGTASIAEVIGVDVDSDLAVIQIDPAGYRLHPVKRGNIDQVRVGMRVAAIGNPFGFEGTLTSGIVSAVGRTIPSRSTYSIPDSIQTDAPINPGNSGGPLINEKGEVIGVNAQIRSEERANSGVGFAIPIAIVERVVPALIADGVYKHSYIGVSGDTFSPICADELGLDPNLRGALVVQVLSRTPAARAGLRDGDAYNSHYPGLCPATKGGDLITAIDSHPVASFDDVLIYLTRFTSPGDTIELSILRDGKEQKVDVTLTERPQ
ncbi:MAG: trypsin-like peptidase domain-containing protein [Caldilineaceae bacterium]